MLRFRLMQIMFLILKIYIIDSFFKYYILRFYSPGVYTEIISTIRRFICFILLIWCLNLWPGEYKITSTFISISLKDKQPKPKFIITIDLE